MPRVRPLEVRALTPLLEQDWETPELLAEALVLALDEVRASRVSYFVTIQHGLKDGNCVYTGMGPYPGYKSALRALEKRGLAQGFEAGVIVAVETPEGFERRLRDLDRDPRKGVA